MSDIDQMNLGPRWYVAHTYSGYENKVKSSIERIVENRGLGHLIFDVQVPVEITRTVNDKGVEREVETKVFPSYVLVKMVMTDESWHVVRNITGVTGFVGPGSKPVPLTEKEVEALPFPSFPACLKATAVPYRKFLMTRSRLRCLPLPANAISRSLLNPRISKWLSNSAAKVA